MSGDSRGFYSEAKFLGQHFKISRGILKKTACMAIEERIMIADLEAIKKVYPYLDRLDELGLTEMIDKVIVPFVENEGFAKWQRDVVTDMAIKKGDPIKSGSCKRKGEEDNYDYQDKDSEIIEEKEEEERD